MKLNLSFRPDHVFGNRIDQLLYRIVHPTYGKAEEWEVEFYTAHPWLTRGGMRELLKALVASDSSPSARVLLCCAFQHSHSPFDLNTIDLDYADPLIQIRAQPAWAEVVIEKWLYGAEFGQQWSEVRKAGRSVGFGDLRQTAPFKTLALSMSAALQAAWKNDFEQVRWKAEHAAFLTLKTMLPTVEIVQHASPVWLAPQHLDIYLPAHKVAVEYQGEQHYRPIDIFGGAEGFEATMRRDETKRRLCALAGVRLEHIHFAEDLDARLRQIALLSLPWSDVLTTNYDTLLERAGRATDRAYDPVRSEAEIAFAEAPRIIKLHGSIGASDHFVIAEEDFRTYPARHAAFVNLARQCFVENELCLLGFSGDDPNFLAWAGWVRDHLGSSARRIFLAGALGLSPAKRKYLEARNIAPIDVADLVQTAAPEHRHALATGLIIDALHALKPVPAYAWRPAPSRSGSSEDDASTRAAALDATLARWREERRSYPGWLVCPSDRRQELRFATEMPRVALLEKIDPARAAQAIGDWCWRHQTALWPIPVDYVAIVRRFADPVGSAHLAPADRLLLAAALLEHARRAADDTLFSEMAGYIESVAPAGSDARAGLRYQQCLQALHAMRLPRAAIERLAEADAFYCIAENRRQSLWKVKGLGEAPLPLFAAADARDGGFSPEGIEPAVSLQAMTTGREVIEDYRSLQLSLRGHPLQFLRSQLDDMRIVKCADLSSIRDGRNVEVAGVILVRQRPGSAKGVLFVTIEDETGVAQGILWPNKFEIYRRQVMSSSMIAMRGRLQKEGEVIHIICDRITDHDAMLRSIGRMDFTVAPGRGDGASHGGGPDPRDPGFPKGRTLSYPLFNAVPDEEELLRIRSHDFH